MYLGQITINFVLVWQQISGITVTTYKCLTFMAMASHQRCRDDLSSCTISTSPAHIHPGTHTTIHEARRHKEWPGDRSDSRMRTRHLGRALTAFNLFTITGLKQTTAEKWANYWNDNSSRATKHSFQLVDNPQNKLLRENVQIKCRLIISFPFF